MDQGGKIARHWNYGAGTYAARFPLLRLSQQGRFAAALRLTEEIAGTKVLELGAGDGYFLTLAAPKLPGSQFLAVDRYGVPSKIEALMAEGRVQFFRDVAEVRDQPLDTIITFETLEHMSSRDIAAFLDFATRNLVAQGRMLVSVPIEVGPPAFVKSTTRALIGKPRRLATPMNVMRCTFGLTDHVPRPDEGTRIGHVGFNHFRLLETIRARTGFRLVRTEYSPFKAMPWFMNSQVFWIFARAEASSQPA